MSEAEQLIRDARALGGLEDRLRERVVRRLLRVGRGLEERRAIHAVGGRDEGRAAGASGDVGARMIAARSTAIDALRAEPAGDPCLDRPDEALPPAIRGGQQRAGDTDLFQLAGAAQLKLFGGDPTGGRGIDMLDPMLEIAEQGAVEVRKNLGYDNIAFRKGYLEELPLEDDEFVSVNGMPTGKVPQGGDKS